MKKTIITIIAIILAYSFSTAQTTTIPAGNVSGTWTLAGSPYLIEGNIVVPDGLTLSVEPGVDIIFSGEYEFDIQGRILAIANSTNSITFTCADTIAEKWKGIRFINTPATNDTSVFHYCNIMYSDSGAIYSSFFSKIKISNSVIRNNISTDGAGIFLNHAGALIIDNTFSYNSSKADTCEGGVIYINGCSNICNITNNTFTSNSAYVSVTFSGWNAYASSYGGVIYIDSSENVNITNNTFTSNVAFAYAPGGGLGSYANAHGGVLYISGSDNINITYNTFTSNSASASVSFGNNGYANTFGGVVYITGSGYIYFTNNTLSSNFASASVDGSMVYAHNYGGGIFIAGSNNIDIINNTLASNSAASTYPSLTDSYGGGVYVSASHAIKISNNNLNLNSAASGGGIYSGDSYVYLSNNIISSNTSAIMGGGVCINNSSYSSTTNPFVVNNIISDNTVSNSYGSGSGMYVGKANPKLYNNIISGNNFTNSDCNGGGIYLDNSNAKIINNSVVYNAASGVGGGIFCTNGSSPLLANSILYGNTCSPHYQLFINDNNSAPIIIYCVVQYDSVGLAAGVTYNQANCTNNIGSDPAFVNFAVQNYHLLNTSPCINAGTPDTTGLTLPPNDLDGNMRVYNGRIDIGPYEYGAPQGIFMNDFSDHLSFYPNPAMNEITLKNESNLEQNIILSLINIQGQLILNEKINFTTTYTINVSGLSNGVYILTLQNGSENFRSKIIIQK